jgi:hypothetical protein
VPLEFQGENLKSKVKSLKICSRHPKMSRTKKNCVSRRKGHYAAFDIV